MGGGQFLARATRFTLWATLALAGGTASAQDDAGFQAYLGQLRSQAIAAGVTRATIDSARCPG